MQKNFTTKAPSPQSFTKKGILLLAFPWWSLVFLVSWW